MLTAIGLFTTFFARALVTLPRMLVRPTLWLRQLDAVLVGAMPLGTAAGVSLGAVVWMHTHRLLARFDAVEALPTALATAVLLELAPIAAGLIVAARSGAQFAAELGAMRQNEQIDALEMLGMSPFRELVAPRVLAAMVALPLLHAFIAAVAIGSGFLAQVAIGPADWTRYLTAATLRLDVWDVFAAGLKTIVFGALIGSAGCFAGWYAEGGTQGVGKAGTQGVVWAMFLVLVSDVFLVGLIRVTLG